MQLTPQQLKIVNHDKGPALVFAVAGAGKTLAITHRIARLVRDGVYRPDTILATVYNKEAAAKLKKDIGSLCGVDTVQACTIHSLGRQIIGRAMRAGKLSYLKPLSRDEEARDPEREVLYKTVHVARRRRLPFVDDLDSYDEDDFLDYVGTCKGKLEYGDLAAEKLPAGSPASQATAPLATPWYLDFYLLYEECRKELGLITFDDMLMTAWQVLYQEPSIRAEYQRRYQCVIVDEFQDVNLAQSEMLDLITASHRNYMVVGDDDQTIYEWRGAKADFILDFEKRYSATRYEMTENFRCKAGAVALANACIARNKKRSPKALGLTQGFDGVTGVHGLGGPGPAAQEIVDIIRRKLHSGLKPDQIRILLRAYAQSPHIEQALIRAGIPYQVLSEAPFYERPEVQTLLDYCRVARLEMQMWTAGPLDLADEAVLKSCWHKIYWQPKRYISGSVIEEIEQLVPQPGGSLTGAIAAYCNQNPEIKCVGALNELRNTLLWLAHAWPGGHFAGESAQEILIQLERRLGYKAWLVRRSGASQAGQNRADTVDALIEYAADYGTLAEFMDHIERLPKSKGRGRQRKQPDKDKIVIQSIHTAKGQEWPVVFLAACNEGVMPNLRAGNLEEERRLFYVAVTRAQQELHIFHDTTVRPSPFLSESEYTAQLPAVLTVRNSLAKEPGAWTAEDVAAVAVWGDRLKLGSYFTHGWWEQSTNSSAAATAADRLAACCEMAKVLKLEHHLGLQNDTHTYWHTRRNGSAPLPPLPGIGEALIALAPVEERAAARQRLAAYEAAAKAAASAAAAQATTRAAAQPSPPGPAITTTPAVTAPAVTPPAATPPSVTVPIAAAPAATAPVTTAGSPTQPAVTTPSLPPAGPARSVGPSAYATPAPARAEQRPYASMQPSALADLDVDDLPPWGDPPDWPMMPLPEEPPDWSNEEDPFLFADSSEHEEHQYLLPVLRPEPASSGESVSPVLAGLPAVRAAYTPAQVITVPAQHPPSLQAKNNNWVVILMILGFAAAVYFFTTTAGRSVQVLKIPAAAAAPGAKPSRVFSAGPAPTEFQTAPTAAAPASIVSPLPTAAPTATLAPPPLPPQHPLPGNAVAVVNHDTALRDGPGYQYGVSSVALRGYQLRLLGYDTEDLDWFLLASGEWIPGKDVTVGTIEDPPVMLGDPDPTKAPTAEAAAVQPSPTATRRPTATPKPTSTPRPSLAVVTADLLNVRDGPSAGDFIAAMLPRDSCVQVTHVQSEWAEVRLPDGRSGWCWREYLSPVTACPTPAPAAACPLVQLRPNAAVRGDTYLHECFGEGDGGLRRAQGGTPVELIGVGPFQPPDGQTDYLGSGPFFKVRLWDGQTAWLPAHAVAADPNAYPQVSGICEPCDRRP